MKAKFSKNCKISKKAKISKIAKIFKKSQIIKKAKIFKNAKFTKEAKSSKKHFFQKTNEIKSFFLEIQQKSPFFYIIEISLAHNDNLFRRES